MDKIKQKIIGIFRGYNQSYEPIEFTSDKYYGDEWIAPTQPTMSSRWCSYCKTNIVIVSPTPWNGRCPKCSKQPFLHKFAKWLTAFLIGIDTWFRHGRFFDINWKAYSKKDKK